MDAVTKSAVEMQEDIDKNNEMNTDKVDKDGKDTAADDAGNSGSAGAAGSGGSGLNDGERKVGVDKQNKKAMDDAMQESKKRYRPEISQRKEKRSRGRA